MFKKIFLVLFFLAALGIGGVSYYVSTIDWNLHKDKIALQFEQLTGKRIVFNGAVSLEFFPTPTLTVQDIKIYNKDQPQNEPPLASIQQLVSDLSLLPLLKGAFKVNKMLLLKPQILVQFSKDGKFNWQPNKDLEKPDFAPAFDVTFNSIMLEDATVHILNPALETDITMQKVNAEISAQSLNGPYRIDGNFMKDNNPAGFALNIGNITESFATSINLVLTHPSSSSYARFDGSVQASTNEIKGNFTMESKNPSNFINELSNQVILPQEYNYPLSSSVELNVNMQQVNLSSFIIKYGDKTAGAGNILIPLEKPVNKNERRVIEMRFDMTNFDLDPIAGMILEQLKLYDSGKLFHPYFDYNVIADIRAVKASFRGETIRNFDFSADLTNDILSIKKLDGLLPGDTQININGDVFEKDEEISYKLQVQTSSQDFLAFLTWLDLKPETYAPSTYRNASSSFEISGNLNQIRLQPFRLTVDKSTLKGLAGIVRKPRPRYFVAAQIDSINLDNYLPALTEEEKKTPLVPKLNLLLNKLSFLQETEMHLEGKLDLGIYNQTPFEKLNVNLDAEKGNVAIHNLEIGDILSSAFQFKGNVSDLNTTPSFSEASISLQNQNFQNLMPLVHTTLPQWPLFEKAQKLKLEASLNGTLQQPVVNTKMELDLTNLVYNGSLTLGNLFEFNGFMDLKTPDFTEFVQAVGFNYKPQNIIGNIFTIKGNISGNHKNWHLDNTEAFIGSNRFNGSAMVDLRNERPAIEAHLQMNKFEFGRFFNTLAQPQSVVLKRGTLVDSTFLEKPLFSVTPIDYTLFKTFDLKADLSSETLSFGRFSFENARTNLEIQNQQIKVSSFTADYRKAPVSTQFEINLEDKPNIKGTAEIKDFALENFGGSRYQITGKCSAYTEFEAPATSEADFVGGLNGFLNLNMDQTLVHGLNLDFIENDLAQRHYSDNLFNMLRDHLQSGETTFSELNAKFSFTNGSYKIEQLLLHSPTAIIEGTGTGNIPNWDVQADFKLTFKNLKEKIVPIIFQWEGPLSTPSLIVAAEALKEKYDSYWENIEREKQEVEAARIKALDDQMSLLQEEVKRFKTSVADNILPKLEKYKVLSTTEEAKNQYRLKQTELVNMNNELDLMAQKPEQEFDHSDLVQMEATLDNFEPQIQTFDNDLDQIYITDLKANTVQNYNKIQDILTNTEIRALNYKTTLHAYAIRLKQLESAVVLDHDPLTQDFVGKIERAILTIQKFADQALQSKETSLASTDISLLAQQKKIMSELADKSEQEKENLTNALENLFTYVQKLVYVEEYGEVVPTEGEKPKIKERIQIIEEPTKEEVLEENPQVQSEDVPEPLLKEIEEQEAPSLNTLEGLISYPSQTASSGMVVKSGNKNNASEKSEGKPRLLRPTARKTMISSGVIKKK